MLNQENIDFPTSISEEINNLVIHFFVRQWLSVKLSAFRLFLLSSALKKQRKYSFKSINRVCNTVRVIPQRNTDPCNIFEIRKDSISIRFKHLGANKPMRLSALAAVEGTMLFSKLKMVCLVVCLELNFLC